MSAAPQTPRLPLIAKLNQLSKAGFVAALKPLFETAPPLAEGLFDGRPYRSYDELLACAETVIAALSTDQQVEVVNAHPRIGERADYVRRDSALSYHEQGYDHEAALDQDDLARVYRELAELNHAYEARFGFRFVVFVNQRPKSMIIDVLRQRLQRPHDAELTTALAEMLAIARDRLATVMS
jgi:2-oxo-4-hydroxy-4-carboxy-5-ureidoimidazoline decarboxylase